MRLSPPDGRLTREHLAATARELERALAGPDELELDLSAVVEIDSAGAALLSTASRRARSAARPLRVTGARPEVAATLALFPRVEPEPPARARPGLLERLGGTAAHHAEVVLDYLLLCADLAWFAVAGVARPRDLRWRQVVNEMAALGSRALGVVGLIAFLVGGTMALQAAVGFRTFGANIYVADLIGISITRELGPLMAAIVVAGRSGSAVAAELATMTITEEVDAVRTMGLNPVRYLVLPKLLAVTLTQPVLTVLADAFGIAGGFVVAVTYLDVGAAAFLGRLEQTLVLKDLLTGLFKSVMFAQLIVTIGALCGLRTRGGADEVGRSTTTSVVASIFAVIVADAAASLVFYFGGR